MHEQGGLGTAGGGNHASGAQVVKAEVNVGLSARASRALGAGFSKSPSLREVMLVLVPEVLVETVRETLYTNTALTVEVKMN